MSVEKLITELKNQRDILADILTEKGVDATHDEKFNTLIPKVRDVSGTEFKFSETNLLTGVTFFDSKYATTVKEGNIVRVTFNSTNDNMWYPLTSVIAFSTKKHYKISVKSWNGFGRLGISKRYVDSFTTNWDNSPFGTYPMGSKCGLNAIGNFNGSDIYNDGDNHVLSSTDLSDKIFKIIPNSYDSLTVNGSLWICSDQLYNGLKESFSIELALYEQI